MMNITEIVSQYPTATHVCLGCGNPFDLSGLDAQSEYCDNTIDCTWPRWYVVADGTTIEDN